MGQSACSGIFKGHDVFPIHSFKLCLIVIYLAYILNKTFISMKRGSSWTRGNFIILHTCTVFSFFIPVINVTFFNYTDDENELWTCPCHVNGMSNATLKYHRSKIRSPNRKLSPICGEYLKIVHFCCLNRRIGEQYSIHIFSEEVGCIIVGAFGFESFLNRSFTI